MSDTAPARTNMLEVFIADPPTICEWPTPHGMADAVNNRSEPRAPRPPDGRASARRTARKGRDEDVRPMARYSGSEGSLKSAGRRMLPWPYWGNPGVAASPGLRFEAVSSGGNNTSELRKSRMLDC